MPSTPTAKLPVVPVLLRIVIYAAIAICSFVIFGSLTSSLMNLDGRCLLFASVTDGVYFPGPRSVCNFNIATAVLLCLLLPAVVIIFIILSIKGKVKINLTNPSFIPAITDSVALVMALVSACIISIGLKITCDNFEICSGASVYTTRSETDTYFFYGTLKTAEIGAWVAFMLWLVQLGSRLVRLWLNRRNSKNTRTQEDSKRESTEEKY